MQETEAVETPSAAAAPPDQINGLTALYNQGRLQDLLAQGETLAQQYPDDFFVHLLVGIANAGTGRTSEAIASYASALQIKPDFAEAHNNLGLVLKDLGKTDEAIASYTKALEIKPDFVLAHTNLCALYDKLNKVADLENALCQAQQSGLQDEPQILFLSAQLSSRKKNFEEALAKLENLPPEKLPLIIQRQYFGLLGKLYDRLGMAEKAFPQFENQNKIAKREFYRRNINPVSAYDNILRLINSWTSDDKLDWSELCREADGISLVFLIGFPRSGTTLLDTILRCHPDIAVVEEKPMVAKMGRQFGRTASISELNRLTASEIAGLRKTYLDELTCHVASRDMDKLVVDKYPLNIWHAGLIHRVFPEAKFILALRHPCDCVLSCFMQNFKLNAAMASFLDLHQSARMYAAVMELWQAYRSALNLDVYKVKYEDLIQDLRGTCRPLIDFLGLGWSDNLLNYRETALGRGLINTPSSDQVIEPLYEQGRGRWENYREQMRPVLPLLEPWIKELGYTG